MRKFIIAVALLLGIMFLIGRMAEVRSIAETLERGDWRYISFAFCLEVLWLINIALAFRANFLAMGIEEKTNKLILLVAAANFINIVAPSAGVGGMAIFLAEARKRGYSSGRVTVAGVLYVLCDYAAFICVLALGLAVLFRRNHLTTAEILATGILLAIAAGLVTLLYLGNRSAQALGRALVWMSRVINKILHLFIHRNYLSEARALEFAHDAADGLHDLHKRPRALLPALLLTLNSKALQILILVMIFKAFQVPYSVGTIIAGFSMANLFLIVSPTPAGLGVVEGVLTLSLNSLNVPLGAAAVITIAYRGITFWVPLLIGMIAFRMLVNSGEIERSNSLQ